jgi:hypothetical protein
MDSKTFVLIFALVAIVGVIGTFAVETYITQQADAHGCKSSNAFNHSVGRCVHP